jgi:DNA polymerase-1
MRTSCTGSATRVIRPYQRKETDPLDFLFLVDSASGSDLYNQQILSGADGQLLMDTLRPFTEQFSFGFSSLVRGWPVDFSTVPTNKECKKLELKEIHRCRTRTFISRQDKKEVVKNCLQFLKRDLERLRPKKIICLGTTLLRLLFPKEDRSLSELIDTTAIWSGIPVSFLQHPFAILKNPSGEATWKSQLECIVLNKKIEFSKDAGQAILLNSFKEISEFAKYLENFDGEVSVDTETENLNKRYRNRLACMQFSFDETAGYVVPWAHGESPLSVEERNELTPVFNNIFAKPNKIKAWICHNAKFECNIFANTFGSYLNSAPIFDTQIASYLLDENRSSRSSEFKYGSYTLKQLAYDYLKFDGYNHGILAIRSEGNLFDLPLKELADYAAMDAVVTMRLKRALLCEAEQQDYTFHLKNLMYCLYTNITRLFSDIERSGNPIDVKLLRKLLSAESPLLLRIKEIETGLRKNPSVIKTNEILIKRETEQKLSGKSYLPKPLIGTPWVFNFAKKGHAPTLFFEVMKMRPVSIGQSGMPSVDAAFQEAYSESPLVAEYTEWSMMRKMFDTFAKGLYDCVDPTTKNYDSNTDGRIRPDYFLSTVVTGRVACRKPNLQNIPRADNEAKKAIKDLFYAPPGNEVRWVGIVANDEKLAESFKLGKHYQDLFRKNPTEEFAAKAELYGDIHKVNASKIFCKNIEDVTKIERQKGKQIVLSLLYDKSEFKLAQELGLEPEEMGELMDAFYAQFSSLRDWKLGMKEHAKEESYVESLHGRRRRFPIMTICQDINGKFYEHMVPKELKGAVNEALRQSSNAPVQGIASDAAMLGASFLNEMLKRDYGTKAFIQNVVHDSVIVQAPFDAALIKDLLPKIEYCLTEQVQDYFELVFSVPKHLPLEVEFEIGLAWGSLEKWDGSEPSLDIIIKKLKDQRKE